MLVSDAIESFLTSVRASRRPATVTYYRQMLTALAGTIGDAELCNVTIEDLRLYFAELVKAEPYANNVHPFRPVEPGRRRSPATIMAHWRAVRRFFRWCAEEGLTPTNTAERLARPSKPRRLPKTVQQQHLAALIAAIPAGSLGDRDRALVLILAGSGMRLGELVGLRWQDLDLVERTARVSGKSGERLVYLPDVAVSALRVYLSRRPPAVDGPVFRGRGGRPLSANAIRKRLEHYATLANVPRVSPHRLRHTFATVFARGGDLHSLQAQLGHCDISTTLIYVQASLHLRDEVDKHNPLAGLPALTEK